MHLICGEALMDVFAVADTPGGVSLDARIGGSPFNVAIGLARMGQVVEPVASTQRLLVERECTRRVISYDPNLRLNVEPDLARWTDTVDWMSRRAHILKVSSEDLELLRPGEGHPAVVAEWLAQGVALVVVTHGCGGASAHTARDSVSVTARRVQVVDTVGAGDTFQAAMLTWFAEHDILAPDGLRNLDAAMLKAMLEFCGAASAITCTRRGADMPRRSELP